MSKGQRTSQRHKAQLTALPGPTALHCCWFVSSTEVQLKFTPGGPHPLLRLIVRQCHQLLRQRLVVKGALQADRVRRTH